MFEVRSTCKSIKKYSVVYVDFISYKLSLKYNFWDWELLKNWPHYTVLSKWWPIITVRTVCCCGRWSVVAWLWYEPLWLHAYICKIRINQIIIKNLFGQCSSGRDLKTMIQTAQFITNACWKSGNFLILLKRKLLLGIWLIQYVFDEVQEKSDMDYR